MLYISPEGHYLKQSNFQWEHLRTVCIMLHRALLFYHFRLPWSFPNQVRQREITHTHTQKLILQTARRAESDSDSVTDISQPHPLTLPEKQRNKNFIHSICQMHQMLLVWFVVSLFYIVYLGSRLANICYNDITHHGRCQYNNQLVTNSMDIQHLTITWHNFKN